MLRTILANAIGEKRRKISSTCTLAKRASPSHIAVMIIIILISYRQDFVSIARDLFLRKLNNSKKLNCSAIYDKKETANYDPFPKHSKTHDIIPIPLAMTICALPMWKTFLVVSLNSKLCFFLIFS